MTLKILFSVEKESAQIKTKSFLKKLNARSLEDFEVNLNVKCFTYAACRKNNKQQVFHASHFSGALVSLLQYLMYVCMQYIYIYVYVDILCVYAYICMYVCMCVCMHVYVYIYIYIYIYTHTHTHTHIYTHT
jgi:hypothetical protein